MYSPYMGNMILCRSYMGNIDLTGSYLCGIVQVSPNQIFREEGDADTPEHTWSESAEANRVCLSDLCLSYKATAAHR